MRWILPIAALVLALSLTDGPAAAQGRKDHNRARAGVQSGEIKPLSDIMGQVRRRHPGRMLDATISKGKGGKPRYRVKVLGNDGRVRELTIDARTGRVLDSR